MRSGKTPRILKYALRDIFFRIEIAPRHFATAIRSLNPGCGPAASKLASAVADQPVNSVDPSGLHYATTIAQTIGNAPLTSRDLVIPTDTFNDVYRVGGPGEPPYVKNEERDPNFYVRFVTSWYRMGASIALFRLTKWRSDNVNTATEAHADCLCPQEKDLKFRQSGVRGPRTIEELTRLLEFMARQYPDKQFQRLTLMGHAPNGWDRRPGIGLTDGNDFVLETITDELVAAIHKVVEPNGTVRLGGCASPNIVDLTKWKQSLQALANRLQRRVVVSGKLAGLDLHSAAHADVWVGAEPQPPLQILRDAMEDIMNQFRLP
jgi:hypothetical protein